MVLEIINLYGAEIIGTLLVAMAGIFGMIMKRIAERALDTPVKQQLAKIAVQFVEQTYKELHGEAKLSAALITFEGLLAEKKISASADEMRVLIDLTERHISVKEISIQAVYLGENGVSHFKTVSDAKLVYREIFSSVKKKR